jgi:uncharacterized protein (DUF433 family)
MATLISMDSRDPWIRRLYLSTYQVKDAARYADITTRTILNWQHPSQVGAAIAARQSRKALSYLQLQELAIVSAMRKQGIALQKIRLAREYLSTTLNLEFPFADERVKTDGQDVLVELKELGGAFNLLVANKGGQYVWREIIGARFNEFEYERQRAVRWNVRGKSSGVVIDPRISFGAPSIRGVPTWALRGRFTAGEPIEDIAEDFVITPAEVRKALEFEKISIQ